MCRRSARFASRHAPAPHGLSIAPRCSGRLFSALSRRWSERAAGPGGAVPLRLHVGSSLRALRVFASVISAMNVPAKMVRRWLLDGPGLGGRNDARRARSGMMLAICRSVCDRSVSSPIRVYSGTGQAARLIWRPSQRGQINDGGFPRHTGPKSVSASGIRVGYRGFWGRARDGNVRRIRDDRLMLVGVLGSGAREVCFG